MDDGRDTGMGQGSSRHGVKQQFGDGWSDQVAFERLRLQLDAE